MLDKITYILGCILAAKFSPEELEYLATNGLISRKLVYTPTGAMYDRGMGQKLAMAHMSRLPLDDRNDLLLWWLSDAQAEVLPMAVLGNPGVDDLSTDLVDAVTKFGSLINYVKSFVGVDKVDDRMLLDAEGNATTGTTDEPNEFHIRNNFVDNPHAYGVIINPSGSKSDPFSPLGNYGAN